MAGESFEDAIRRDVRNNPIVREIDRERHREMWRAVLVGLFLLGVLLFSVWREAELLHSAYDIDSLRQAIEREEAERQRLLLEVEVRSAPARIERLATLMGMVEPGPGEHDVIERIGQTAALPRSAVARR